MATDEETWVVKVLGAIEHIENEVFEDKRILIGAVLGMRCSTFPLSIFDGRGQSLTPPARSILASLLALRLILGVHRYLVFGDHHRE